MGRVSIDGASRRTAPGRRIARLREQRDRPLRTRRWGDGGIGDVERGRKHVGFEGRPMPRSEGEVRQRGLRDVPRQCRGLVILWRRLFVEQDTVAWWRECAVDGIEGEEKEEPSSSLRRSARSTGRGWLLQVWAFYVKTGISAVLASGWKLKVKVKSQEG